MKNTDDVSENMMDAPEAAKNRKGISKVIFILILLAAVVAAGFYAYKYYTLLQDPNSVAREEVQDLVAKVGKLIDLPEEEPTVATVVDAEALKSQAFFAKAEQGDKVLIYPNAKKAFLYSVNLNKIIEVGPILLGDQETNPAPETDIVPEG